MHAEKLITLLFGLDKINEGIPFIIWGAGQRGKRLLHYLNDLGVEVAAFGDNDENKHGMIVEGIKCCSINSLKGRQAYVIVSPVDSNDLYKDLKKEFDYVFPTEIVEILAYLSYIVNYESFYPLGHFYSLYPDLKYVNEHSNDIFNSSVLVSGINFNEARQLTVMDQLSDLYDSIPNWKYIEDNEPSELRFRYHNTAMSPIDAVNLHCMLRLLKPNKMIEVGSGWSSAVTLDTNEYYLNNKIEITFIEPYGDLLRNLSKKTDHLNLMEIRLQDVPLEFFSSLNAGDILFIDSTHVSKVGSDVNYLFFEIFPHLKKGVYIHLHDIFYPFEYPREWLVKGKVWNELYLLRAFLQNNNSYSIVYFENMIEKKHYNKMLSKWPLQEPINGGSFWMQKISEE